ncbi:hypothetical protein PYH37_005205 [Sinorhizobium numidicum]|uniref:Uncharacterized protein n=1 Tax=Sinorhizobium numidicum TaxID=680248 RepID=A0ABY8D2Y0_9HYPH|nr:hypothetical protein [Sinorhizobium numidicum]WEX76855.1 hypothetical protein PYH37_005205 [Sinorhizobium numidicum]WEX83516.1 hypothetical protein PYH38_002298 [Sinorhizobium numidicum]
MKTPAISKLLIVADDAKLAAQASCRFSSSGQYLPIVDGPRMSRPDWPDEVLRRSNVAARIRPEQILFAGVSDTGCEAMCSQLPRSRIERVSTSSDLPPFSSNRPPLRWGRNRIGLGLLTALRAKTEIFFDDTESPLIPVPSKSGHLVVCEAGEELELESVIAANYAFSLQAGMAMIPHVPQTASERILERFYSVYDDLSTSATKALEELRAELRALCAGVEIPPHGSITFVSRRLPFGFAFPEVPSTHLFIYPDLGTSVVNGFTFEETERATKVAVVVDPGQAEAPEIEAAAHLLASKGTFVRGYSDAGASVRAISEMIEHFPYDLLIVATHCGDVPGHRWTYEFTDSEGIDRELVVDIALGIASTDDPDLLRLTRFVRFHSLDRVDWNDPAKKEKLYVGTAIKDYAEWVHEQEPVYKDQVERVIGSAALRMYDHNIIPIPRSLASGRTPVVINNACVSWHELAARFLFANARAYIGSLFPISTSEAHDVVLSLLGKHIEKPLAHALWASQRGVYGESVRRPYVVSGVYPQRLYPSWIDAPRHIVACLSEARQRWHAFFNGKQRLKGPSKTVKVSKDEAAILAYFDREIASIRSRYGLK